MSVLRGSYSLDNHYHHRSRHRRSFSASFHEARGSPSTPARRGAGPSPPTSTTARALRCALNVRVGGSCGSDTLHFPRLCLDRAVGARDGRTVWEGAAAGAGGVEYRARPAGAGGDVVGSQTWSKMMIFRDFSQKSSEMIEKISRNFLLQFRCCFDILFELLQYVKLLCSSTPGGHLVDGVPPD